MDRELAPVPSVPLYLIKIFIRIFASEKESGNNYIVL